MKRSYWIGCRTVLLSLRESRLNLVTWLLKERSNAHVLNLDPCPSVNPPRKSPGRTLSSTFCCRLAFWKMLSTSKSIVWTFDVFSCVNGYKNIIYKDRNTTAVPLYLPLMSVPPPCSLQRNRAWNSGAQRKQRDCFGRPHPCQKNQTLRSRPVRPLLIEKHRHRYHGLSTFICFATLFSHRARYVLPNPRG